MADLVFAENRWINFDRATEIVFTPKGTIEGKKPTEQDRLRFWFGPEDSATFYGDVCTPLLAELAEREKAGGE